MRYTVALTGGIGSGKSTVADAFSRLGINVIDADIIARQVVEPGTTALQAIATHFGSQMLNDDGTLNRRALREKSLLTLRIKPGLTGYYIRSFSRKLAGRCWPRAPLIFSGSSPYW